MRKYWKLLNIEDGEYSVHETEEEVNRIIEYRTRDLSDYKVIKRINIETPFSNYDFQFVYVFDEHHIHQFLYFFDTIEEQCDDFEERIKDLSNQLDEITKQRDNAINLLNKKTTDLFNANRTIEFLRKSLSNHISELESVDSERSEIEYLKEVIKSKESRIDTLEAGIKESERTNSYLREHNQNLKELISKINDMTHPF